jgi:catechol 2,3-dioxygenase-like lactoylglutathione lyase family enzyme
MQLASPTVILDVPDMQASSQFLRTHLGFEVAMATDAFILHTHDDHGMRVLFQPYTGSPSAAARPEQLQIGFIVEDIDAKWNQLKDHAPIEAPIQTMDSGERYFKITDPNGITYRLVQWVN